MRRAQPLLLLRYPQRVSGADEMIGGFSLWPWYGWRASTRQRQPTALGFSLSVSLPMQPGAQEALLSRRRIPGEGEPLAIMPERDEPLPIAAYRKADVEIYVLFWSGQISP